MDYVFLYLCNPSKNHPCKKTHCGLLTSWGECYHTPKKEFSTNYSDGKEIEMKDFELVGENLWMEKRR